jgi:hypothetical protein
MGRTKNNPAKFPKKMGNCSKIAQLIAFEASSWAIYSSPVMEVFLNLQLAPEQPQVAG